MSDLSKVYTLEKKQRKALKTICEKRQDNVSRICAQKKCQLSANRNLCSSINCQCNKHHSACYQFINFQYLKTTFKEYQDQSLKDLFQKLLRNLTEIAQASVKAYNKLYDFFETYCLPESFFNAYLSLKNDSIVNKKISIELRQFCDKYPRHQLPKMMEIPEYKQKVEKILKKSDQTKDSIITSYRQLFKDITQQEKKAKIIIENINIEKHSKKQQQKRQEDARNQSKNKSQQKK